MTDERSDAELLGQYGREGTESAFAALVQRHLSLVYGTAYRQLHDQSAAAEVTQSVFVTLARRAVWLTGHPSLAGWLYRTTVHLAKHELRGEQRRRWREQTAVELGTTMKSDESLLSELAPVLDEVLLELRAGDREALLLRYFADKSMREVGQALGVREEAAQKRVSKAVEELTARFRRRGFKAAAPAVAVLALQKAAAASVPAGLAALTTKAALSAGAAASLTHLAVPALKFMSLTKIQTTTLCVVLAAVPLGYQWQALSKTREATDQLKQQLETLRAEGEAREREQASAERRTAEFERRLAESAAPRSPTAPAPGPNPSLFVWDDASPYVRLPKGLLAQLHFGAFGTRKTRDGKTERYQLRPLGVDGTPQPALEAALGLSPEEADQLRSACRTTFAAFQDAAAKHSEITEVPFLDGKAIDLKISAFPAEGAALQDQFRAALTASLGADRTAAFWQQTEPVFSDLLNGFGAQPHEYKLINRPGHPLVVNEFYQGAGSFQNLDDRLGRPLPPALQPYADAWASVAQVVPPPSQP